MSSVQPLSDKVEDDEKLYRSIWNNPSCFTLDEDGVFRVSSFAFSDPDYQPSLFRHHLCDDPPQSNPPRFHENGAVAIILAKTIRMPANQVYNKPGETQTYLIDVRPKTDEGEHRSHAIVFVSPELDTKKGFAKIRERLARLVERDWAIPPSDEIIGKMKGLPSKPVLH